MVQNRFSWLFVFALCLSPVHMIQTSEAPIDATSACSWMTASTTYKNSWQYTFSHLSNSASSYCNTILPWMAYASVLALYGVYFYKEYLAHYTPEQPSSLSNIAYLHNMSTAHGGDATALRATLQNHAIVIVDVYNTACAPCKRLAPELEKIAAQHPALFILKANSYKTRSATLIGNINAYPTLVLFNNEQEVDRIKGYRSAEQIIEWIQSKIPTFSISSEIASPATEVASSSTVPAETIQPKTTPDLVNPGNVENEHQGKWVCDGDVCRLVE
jgi:thioredoxin 1